MRILTSNATASEVQSELNPNIESNSSEDLFNVDQRCAIPKCSIFILCIIILFIITLLIIIACWIKRKYYSRNRKIYLQVRALSVHSTSEFNIQTAEKRTNTKKSSTKKDIHESNTASKETALDLKLQSNGSQIKSSFESKRNLKNANDLGVLQSDIFSGTGNQGFIPNQANQDAHLKIEFNPNQGGNQALDIEYFSEEEIKNVVYYDEQKAELKETENAGSYKDFGYVIDKDGLKHNRNMGTQSQKNLAHFKKLKNKERMFVDDSIEFQNVSGWDVNGSVDCPSIKYENKLEISNDAKTGPNVQAVTRRGESPYTDPSFKDNSIIEKIGSNRTENTFNNNQKQFASANQKSKLSSRNNYGNEPNKEEKHHDEFDYEEASQSFNNELNNSKLSKIEPEEADKLAHSDWDLDSSANQLVIFKTKNDEADNH